MRTEFCNDAGRIYLKTDEAPSGLKGIPQIRGLVEHSREEWSARQVQLYPLPPLLPVRFPAFSLRLLPTRQLLAKHSIAYSSSASSLCSHR